MADNSEAVTVSTALKVLEVVVWSVRATLLTWPAAAAWTCSAVLPT
jgi:hypothetical protein